jgi:nucleoside-diphosphate-sugar epimerase
LPNSRTAIVTGSSGFIGKSLSKQLKSLSWEVIGVELTPDQTSVSPDSIIDRINQNEFNSATTTFFHVGADANAAALSLSDLHYKNVRLTEMYFDAVSRRHIPTIFVSSAAIYGNKKLSSAISPYAESKIIGEKMLRDYQLERAWPAIVFRLFNTYGSGEGEKGSMVSIPRKFINSARATQEIEIWDVPGNTVQSRDFIGVCDVISALCDAAISGAVHNGGTFDLGTGLSVDYRRVAELVAQFIPTEIRNIPFPSTQKLNYYQLKTQASTLYQMKNAPDFRYTPIEEGIKSYIDSILSGDES